MPQVSLRFVGVCSLGLALALGSMSCSEDAGPKTRSQVVLPDSMKLLTQDPNARQVVVQNGQVFTPDNLTLAPLGQAPVGPTPLAAPPKRVIPKEDVVVPPPDAHWTLFVASFDGGGHIENAKAAKDQLKSATGSSKFYVVHEDARSVVYFGFYSDIDSRYKAGKLAQADKEYLKGLKTSSGESPLTMIYFEPITGATPDAPAEWDMAKIARSPEHYWSLQIAAYTADARGENGSDVTDRKSAAVESVRALRAHGIEAYFYHGESISSVCVGMWPENAVKRQDGGNSRGNASTVNPDERLLVANALPSGIKDIKVEGEKVKALSPKLEVLDPAMMAIMRQFPTHAINGYEMMRTYGKGTQRQTSPDPSVLVLVPEAKTAMPTGLPNEADLQNLQLRPASGNATPAQPGVGRLRSVDE